MEEGFFVGEDAGGAGAELGVCEETVQCLVRRKVLRELSGLRRVLIPKAEVQRYLDAGEGSVPAKTVEKNGPETAQKKPSVS
jgi:hypothetical protein